MLQKQNCFGYLYPTNIMSYKFNWLISQLVSLFTLMKHLIGFHFCPVFLFWGGVSHHGKLRPELGFIHCDSPTFLFSDVLAANLQVSLSCNTIHFSGRFWLSSGDLTDVLNTWYTESIAGSIGEVPLSAKQATALYVVFVNHKVFLFLFFILIMWPENLAVNFTVLRCLLFISLY